MTSPSFTLMNRTKINCFLIDALVDKINSKNTEVDI